MTISGFSSWIDRFLVDGTELWTRVLRPAGIGVWRLEIHWPPPPGAGFAGTRCATDEVRLAYCHSSFRVWIQRGSRALHDV